MGPYAHGKGHLYANTNPDSNRTLYTSLKTQGAVDALTFKQPDLLKHVTYKHKFAPPKSWDQFIQDPLGWLQLWDKFQSLPLADDEQLQIVSDTRSFLDVDTLPSLQSNKPTIDPIRFQSLDWLPTIQQVTSKINTGFPSDHYLVKAKIRIELRAQIKCLSRKPKLEYTAGADTARTFNQAFQQRITELRGTLLKATPPSSLPDFPPLPVEERTVHVYTDGSGSTGKRTSTTPAGWGYVVVVSDVVTHEAYSHHAAHYRAFSGSYSRK